MGSCGYVMRCLHWLKAPRCVCCTCNVWQPFCGIKRHSRLSLDDFTITTPVLEHTPLITTPTAVCHRALPEASPKLVRVYS